MPFLHSLKSYNTTKPSFLTHSWLNEAPISSVDFVCTTITSQGCFTQGMQVSWNLSDIW